MTNTELDDEIAEDPEIEDLDADEELGSDDDDDLGADDEEAPTDIED